MSSYSKSRGSSSSLFSARSLDFYMGIKDRNCTTPNEESMLRPAPDALMSMEPLHRQSDLTVSVSDLSRPPVLFRYCGA